MTDETSVIGVRALAAAAEERRARRAARTARITERARNARPGELALTGLTWLVMAMPWLLGLLARTGWFLSAWIVSAAIEGATAGWQAGPKVDAPP